MMMVNEATIVEQIQDRLKGVYNTVAYDLPPVHEKSGETVDQINDLHEKVVADERRLAGNSRSKLKGLYLNAIDDAEAEEEVLRAALKQIYEIRSLRNDRRILIKQSGNKETIRRGALMKALQSSAQFLPLWIGKVGEKPPPLCGSTPAEPSYIANVGDMVAALQRSPDGDDNWILAEVINYNNSTNKYELDDIDEEQKEKIMLSRRRVIPLPLMRANPETDPEALFQANSIVMALYPQTTCFYKAVVSVPPATHGDEYEVLFEDSTYPDGYSPPMKVPQKYVFVFKEKYMRRRR